MSPFERLFRRRRRALLFEERRPSEVKRARIGASMIEIGRFSYGYERMRVLEWGEGAALRIG
ncbi:MAG: hypothetical protein ACK4NE_08435, partial [Albidovulum sp.]